MHINGKAFRTIWFDKKDQTVKIIDQTKLPHKFEVINLKTTKEAINAIKTMKVRGAPLIGATAAYGVVLAIMEKNDSEFIKTSCQNLIKSRPTAINLKWAVNRMQKKLSGVNNKEVLKIALEEASLICEELSEQFPFKAELHQFMILTALRKQEALKIQKGFINWDERVINIPKGIEKNRKHDQVIVITPELEVLIHNIFDIGDRPGLDFYKMKDFPWLFATRKWGSYRYFNKEFRHSSKARLGGDENYVPELRRLMREKSGDPELLYSSKVLRKTYITLSKQRNDGRSDKVKHLSRHSSEQILEAHYDKPSIDTIRGYAEKTSEVFNFIQRRSA